MKQDRKKVYMISWAKSERNTLGAITYDGLNGGTGELLSSTNDTVDLSLELVGFGRHC